MLRPIFLMSLLFAVSITEPARIIVLGTAQDGGVPHIGCTQKICRTQHHPISSMAALTDELLLLFDATPDLREQHSELVKRYPEYQRKNLFDAVFLTHAHMGHYPGLLYFGKESISTQKVPVYCSSEMSSYLKNNAPWNLLVKNNNIELRAFESGKDITLGGVTVTPLAVPHRKEFTDTHGFLIRGRSKSLLFIPDIDSWQPIQGSIEKWIKEADYALLDGTFYSGDELPGRDIRQVPHPTVQASISFFDALKPFACSIYFTHLNHTNPLFDPDTPQWKDFSKTNYRLATDWQEFEL